VHLYIAGKIGNAYVIVPFSWDVFNKGNATVSKGAMKKTLEGCTHPHHTSRRSGGTMPAWEP